MRGVYASPRTRHPVVACRLGLRHLLEHEARHAGLVPLGALPLALDELRHARLGELLHLVEHLERLVGHVGLEHQAAGVRRRQLLLPLGIPMHRRQGWGQSR